MHTVSTNVTLVPHVFVDHLRQIRIMLNIEISASLLRSNEGEQDHVRVNRTHEDADDLAIVVSLDRCFTFVEWGERKSFSNCRFNSRRSRRRKISELIRPADLR